MLLKHVHVVCGAHSESTRTGQNTECTANLKGRFTANPAVRLSEAVGSDAALAVADTDAGAWTDKYVGPLGREGSGDAGAEGESVGALSVWARFLRRERLPGAEFGGVTERLVSSVACGRLGTRTNN